MPTIEHQPPPEFLFVPADARPHWRAVVAGLPASPSPVHVVLAAQLARCMADIERLDAERRRTDNPRRAVLLLRVSDSLTRQSIALSRCIGLAPSARHRLADVQARRLAERRAREVAQSLHEL